MPGAFVRLVSDRGPSAITSLTDRLRSIGLGLQLNPFADAAPWSDGQLPILWLLDSQAGKTAIKDWVSRARGPLESKGGFLVALLVAAEDRDARAYWTGMGLGTVVSPDCSPAELEHLLKEARQNALSPARRVAQLIQTMTGVQLPPNKDPLIKNRLTRRLLEVGVKDLDEYIHYLETHKDTELSFLVSNLTTHTTEFFRDSEHFDDLVKTILPGALARGEPIRIWSAACSTGEEVYSLAMAVAAFLDKNPAHRDHPWEIFGTDVDPKSAARARNGVYPVAALKKVSRELVQTYFDLGSQELSHLARVKDTLWKHCRFGTFNLLLDRPQEENWTAVFVRNVFIYFKPEDIQRVAKNLAATLEPSGKLYLGASEFLDEGATGLKRVGKATYQRPQRTAPAREKSRLIRVLVVDDSKTMRAMIKEILNPKQGFEVVAEAEDPIQARELLKTVSADLMTLDIHMPRMDGITYLAQKRDPKHPPIVVMSSVNEQEALQVFRCLELGAVDYIEKPKGRNFAVEADSIRATLRGALYAKRKADRKQNLAQAESSTIEYDPAGAHQQLILIGGSTGGIEALREILPEFPSQSPPILIVQHIPTTFSAMFAKRLDDLCNVRVKEAEADDVLTPGTAYIAPGGRQMTLQRDASGQLRISLEEGSLTDLYRPCVDTTFRSVAQVMARQRLGVSVALLTGMGRDGAMGLKSLKDLGAHTIAQDEASCVVFGMPKAAIELRAAQETLPLERIPAGLFSHFKRQQRHASKKVA